MANYNVTTKVIIAPITDKTDQIDGSLAKLLNDYLQTVDDAKTIRAISVQPLSSGTAIIVIVHNS